MAKQPETLDSVRLCISIQECNAPRPLNSTQIDSVESPVINTLNSTLDTLTGLMSNMSSSLDKLENNSENLHTLQSCIQVILITFAIAKVINGASWNQHGKIYTHKITHLWYFVWNTWRFWYYTVRLAENSRLCEKKNMLLASYNTTLPLPNVASYCIIKSLITQNPNLPNTMKSKKSLLSDIATHQPATPYTHNAS